MCAGKGSGLAGIAGPGHLRAVRVIANFALGIAAIFTLLIVWAVIDNPTVIFGAGEALGFRVRGRFTATPLLGIVALAALAVAAWALSKK